MIRIHTLAVSLLLAAQAVAGELTLAPKAQEITTPEGTVFMEVYTSALARTADKQLSVDQQSGSSSTDPDGATSSSRSNSISKSGTHAASAYQFPNAPERFKNYVKSTFSLGTVLISAIAGGVAQGRNAPPEWGQGAQGYGERFASALGERFISGTATYGLGEALHEDTSYHKCECKGGWNRLAHAFKESFTARTESGREVPSLPALVGPYVGGVAGVYAWYPNRFGWKDGIRDGTSLLISKPLLGILREFRP